MSRTINGKSFQRVMEELNTPFTNYTLDFNGKEVIPYELLKSRANEVLGLNYSDEVLTRYFEIEGQHLIEAKATISLFDDEGRLVASRSHVRSDILTRYASGKPKAGEISFDNDDFSSVVSLAYKKAFALFGLGDQFALNKAKKKATHRYGAGDGNSDPSACESKERGVKAVFTLTKTNRSPEGDSVTFISDEGKSHSFEVKDPSAVEGYKELLTASPGALVTTYFLLPSWKLLKVEIV